MEKQKPHHDLAVVKRHVRQIGMDALTRTAKDNSRRMGLDEAATLRVIQSLSPVMFMKSMTTYTNHRAWQDVYLAPCPNGKTAYIKVSLQEGAIVIQFKEK